MKKKYICRLSATNILVRVHGVVKRLEFEPDVITNYGLRGCSYSTEDKDIQSAVENHPQFRTGQRNAITVFGELFSPVVKEVVVPAEEKEIADEKQEVKKVVRRGKAKKEE